MKITIKQLVILAFISMRFFVNCSFDILSMWNKETVEKYCNILPNIRTGEAPIHTGFPLLDDEAVKNTYLKNLESFDIFKYENVIHLLDLSINTYKNLYISTGMHENSPIFDKDVYQEDFPQLAFF